jgi:hypothetical protein
MQDGEAELSQARRSGMLVVAATVSRGLHAGVTIMAISPRTAMLDGIAELWKMSEGRRHQMAVSIIRSLLRSLSRPFTTPKRDEALFDNLTVLLALVLLEDRRRQQWLDEVGLLTIGLAIEADESLPWQERGMLPPDLTTALSLDVRPAHLHG